MNKQNFGTGLEIAVIGMAARFPAAKNTTEFWNNLKNGVESIRFFTDEQLEEAGIALDLIQNPRYVKANGVLEDIEYFDASFFGYTPNEADVMDPQVRIFHECVWTALEDAGYDPYSYKGLIGLYAGATPHFDWQALSLISGKSSKVGLFTARHFDTKDFMCGRISHKLNLTGPCFSLYTACSTSLVAVHLACQAILNGECDMALAGGVTVTILDSGGYMYEEGMVKSPDGHCRPFDAASTGIVGGNGAGAVLLKRLEDALADRDYIYAVVKGSSVNNDGNKKVAYAAPSVEGQVEVIHAAQMMAEVEPESVTYVEAHGTGTELGDPIEVEALKIAFNTGKKNFCGIGSVKSNIGHTDSAAGVASFIKAVLALKHRLIPPSINVETPNPKLGLEGSPFYVNTHLREWQNEKYPLRAAVSSFGIGGTNAHIILEEWPDSHSSNAERTAHGAEQRVSSADPLGANPVFARDEEHGPRSVGAQHSVPSDQEPRGESMYSPLNGREHKLILLSAKSHSALERNTKNLAEYLKRNPGIDLADAAYTLQLGRGAFNYRRVTVCAETGEAVEALSDAGSAKVQSCRLKEEKRTVVFMFSALGSEYVNMGLGLYRKEPLFREEMDRCCTILEPIIGCNVKDIIYPEPGREKEAEEKIKDPVYSSAVKFIFEYSVARLLMKWGIEPEAMIGYSFGEYTVACLAGVISLEDALSLVVLRGKLINKLPAGGMLNVTLSQEELKPLLNDELSLAAVNTSSLSVVSGPNEMLDIFQELLRSKGVEYMRIQVDKAGHSKMMRSITGEFAGKVKQVKFNKPQVPYISGMTGRWISVQEAMDADYWTRHLMETVRFADGVRELLKKPNRVFVQVGCDRALPQFVRQMQVENGSEELVLTMVKHKKEMKSDVYNQLGQLWLWGVPIDWREFHSQEKRQRIPLPTYSFDRLQCMTKGDPYKMAVEMLAGMPLAKKEIADWFYIPSWLRSRRSLDRSVEIVDLSLWLVFLDECGLGAGIADQLKQKGQEVVTVKAGAEFYKQGPGDYIVNPRNEKDYLLLVDELKGRERSLKRIFHLWNVSKDTHEGLKWEHVENALDRGLYSLVYLAKAFGARDFKETMQIEVITNNMQDVGGEEFLCPGKATVLGAVRVMPLEFSNIGCRSIDIVLPPSGSRQEERLIQQLLTESAEESFVQVLAFRGNERWEQTLKPIRLEKAVGETLALKEKGVYLITGGLGGIALEMARFLAKKVKAKLILFGRSPLPPRKSWKKWLENQKKNDKDGEKIRKVKELEELGAEVLVLTADVADDKQMRELITRTRKRFGTINGVIHSAGVTGGGSIQLITRDSLASGISAKVKGTVLLANLLEDVKLDFFVLCSSGNSIIPVFGQVDYCAANAFLDAFANYNTVFRGNFTQSVNLTRWKNTGMSVEFEKKHKENTGTELAGGITAREGIEAFDRTLRLKLPQIIVNTRDLRSDMEFRKQRPKRIIEPAADADEAAEEAISRVNLRRRPELSEEYVPARNETEQKLVELFRDFFGMEKVGINDDFFELGGDSLRALTLTARIKREVNPNITLSNLLLHPTIRELAASTRVVGKFDKLECIVPLNEGQNEKNIFFVHPRHGMVYQYKELGRLLENDFNVYGIQARGLLKKSKMPKNFSIAAGDYIRQMREVQKEGPYIIAAFCIGDMIAYHMVRQLEDMKCEVERFIMLDEYAFVPGYILSYYRQQEVFDMLVTIVKKLLGLAAKGSNADKAGDFEKMLSEIEQDGVKNKSASYVSAEEAESLKKRVKQHFGKLISDWETGSALKRIPGIIKAPILEVKAKDSILIIRDRSIKKMTLGKVTFETISGEHDTMFKSPHVEELAEAIRRDLKASSKK